MERGVVPVRQLDVVDRKNVNSGLYLGVAGSSTSDGANVVQWAATGSAEQQWQLLQVSGM